MQQTQETEGEQQRVQRYQEELAADRVGRRVAGPQSRPRRRTTGIDSPAAAPMGSRAPRDLSDTLDGRTPIMAGGGVVSLGETGLASLDEVAIPRRGVKFEFATARGRIEITARGASNGLIRGLQRLGWTILVVVFAAIIAHLARRDVGLIVKAPWLSTLLIVLGAISIVAGLLPVVGLVLVVAGIVVRVQRAHARRREALAT